MSSCTLRLQHKARLCIGNRRRSGSKVSPDKAPALAGHARGRLCPDSVDSFAEDDVERVAGLAGGDPGAGRELLRAAELSQRCAGHALARVVGDLDAPSALESRLGEGAALRGDDGDAEAMGLDEHAGPARLVDIPV